MQPTYILLWRKQLGHVMKNWLPLVFGPVFTIDKQPEKQQAGCIENNIPSSQQINLKNWKNKHSKIILGFQT